MDQPPGNEWFVASIDVSLRVSISSMASSSKVETLVSLQLFYISKIVQDARNIFHHSLALIAGCAGVCSISMSRNFCFVRVSARSTARPHRVCTANGSLFGTIAARFTTIEDLDTKLHELWILSTLRPGGGRLEHQNIHRRSTETLSPFAFVCSVSTTDPSGFNSQWRLSGL